MICKSCGAEFDNTLPKCPYCGSFNYEGAQKEYMEKLEDIHEDLDDLHEEVQEIYTTELKQQAKGIKKIVIVLAIIFAVFALLFFIAELLFDSAGGYDPKAALLFEQEAFPIADEYFEAGDYEGLLEFAHNSLENNENAGFYNWEHHGFLLFYENYTNFSVYAQNLESTHATDFDLLEVLYYYITSEYDLKAYPISSEDQQLIESFRHEMKDVIDSLEFTEEEMKEFNDLLNDPEVASWDDIEDFSKKVYKRKYQ